MTERIIVLVVDDEPNNLRTLTLDLEGQGYEIMTASNGLEAWDVLQQNRDNIKAILLDRMMPLMDGMEFMERLVSYTPVSRIPVIMQTAAAEHEQVMQGIKAGVYYYLTKPYDKNVMLAIVRAAVNDRLQHDRLLVELSNLKKGMHLIRDGRFELKTLEDAKHIAPIIANVFPEPERTVLGVLEMLINAIEHGNLGIGYEDKGRLNSDGTWEEEIKKRQKISDNYYKKVLMFITRDTQKVTLRIKDEGEGFEWKKYLGISPERATHSHGRGIAMANIMSFDELEYNSIGNEVTCRVNLGKNEHKN